MFVSVLFRRTAYTALRLRCTLGRSRARHTVDFELSNILIIKYHRQEADGGCCRVMGKGRAGGSSGRLHDVFVRVAARTGGEAGPRTPAPNVIIVLC